MEQPDRFEEEREEIFNLVKAGIETNIPLKPTQKKYLKNLLLFSVMRASTNQTIAKPKFINLVAKQFKKYIVKIIHGSMKKQPNYNPLEDEDFYDENLEVTINNIIANEQLIDLYKLQQSLTPQNIVGQIRFMTDGVQSREILSKLLALREGKMNHRETPEEVLARDQRQRQRERQRQRVRQNERGGRDR